MTGVAAPDDVAAYARRLLPGAQAAFQEVADHDSASLFAALDAFIAAPAPSTFVAAFRLLGEARRRRLMKGPGGALLRRGFDDGVNALRGTTALPREITDLLAIHLPVDVRAGNRLRALAALATAYQELDERVAADTDHRRRLWKSFPRRRPRSH